MSKRRNYSFITSELKFEKESKRGMYKDGVFKNGWISHNYINQYVKGDDGLSHIVGEHIIKWIFFNGEIPDGMEIDHINGDKQDNRLENLRCVTHPENCNNENTKINITNALKKHYDENPEDKVRLSELHKGKTPWNKGKTNIYSVETLAKMSIVAKIKNKNRERNEKGQFTN